MSDELIRSQKCKIEAARDALTEARQLVLEELEEVGYDTAEAVEHPVIAKIDEALGVLA